MAIEGINDIFSPEVLQKLFPEDRTDQFFDALYGDASEGVYDISLKFNTHRQGQLEFELHLSQRPSMSIESKSQMRFSMS